MNTLLDLSKLEASKMSLEEKTSYLVAIVRKVFANFESRARHKGLNFELKNEVEEELLVQLDTNKFEKILNNLLSNAIKFTPKGGRVEVLLEDQGVNFQIQVKDTGRGIPKQDLPHIFERYYQSRSQQAPTEGVAALSRYDPIEDTETIERSRVQVALFGTFEPLRSN